jgi:hypothetical protein
MFRLKIALIIGGGVLAWFGFQEMLLNSGSSSKAVVVDLAELESGRTPEDNHLKIGEHLAVYPGCVYSYSANSKYESVTPTTRIQYCYYPVISNSHPFLRAVDEVQQRHGGIENVPEEEFPTIDDFALLVKTRRFQTLGDIPDGFVNEPQLQGMVVNQVTSLDSDEKQLLLESFPNADLDKVVILEDGRAPSPLKSYGMTFGGVLLIVVGIASFFIGRGGDTTGAPNAAPNMAPSAEPGGNPQESTE